MKKKLISAFLITAFFMCFSVCYANTALSLKSQDEMINVIKMLEIANGDQNGNMMFDSNVTRAQFVKMAVSASLSKQNAQDTKLNVSLFPDVKNDFWGAGYIYVAVKNGLITGYLDGTFKPDNSVKLEEAVTIVLKLLGYTDNEVMGAYPNSQIAKYKSLGLDAKINAKVGENLTRLECMQLLYNALSADNNSGSVYCTTLGYKTDSDGIIDYNALVEAKLKGPHIILAEKSESLKTTLGNGYTNYVYYRDGKTSSFSEICEYDALYYVKEINTAWAYSSKIFGVVQSVIPDSINPTAAVISENTVNICSGATGTELLKKDTYVMLVLDRAGSAFAVYKADADMYNKYHDSDSDSYDVILSSVSSPFVVTDLFTWKTLSQFNVNSETEYLYNGTVISENDICENDILYYSEAFNTILVYRKTATGIVKGITQQNNAPVSVVLTDKTYNLATDDVKNMFAVNGKYSKENSFVTLLLGMNDGVVSAIDGDISKISDNTENTSYLEMLALTFDDPVVADKKGVIPSFDINTNTQIFLNDKTIGQSAVEVNDVIYYSETFNTAYVFRKTATGIVKGITQQNNAPVSVVLTDKTYNLATDDVKNMFAVNGKYSKENSFVTLLLGMNDGVVFAIDGDISKISENTNNASYLEMVAMTLEGPYTVNTSGKIDSLPFDSENAKYIRDGETILLQDIRKNDVYYYSQLLESVWIYRDTVSGVLEEVNNVTSPSSIVVSGKTYSVESQDASFALSTFGSFRVGNTITILLGKDGVVAITNPDDDTSAYIYGIVTDKGKKTFKKSDGTTYSAEYVTVTDTACQTYTYEYENSYFANGDVVRVTVGNKVSISKQTSNIGSGNVANIKNAIKNGDFASDCEIIDVYSGNVKKVYTSRISGLDIDPGEFTYSGIVKFYLFNEDGEIEKLILNDFTGDIHDYGIVTSSYNGAVKYLLEDTEKTFASDNLVSEGPAMIKTGLSGVASISPLMNRVVVDVLTNYSVFDEAGNEYPLSDRVKVYIANTASYTYSKINDVISDDYILEAYYDKAPRRGGRIRVIIAKRTS